MSWGDGLLAGIEKSASIGPESLPTYAARALYSIVGDAYEALVPKGAAAAPLRLKLAVLHIELAAVVGYGMSSPGDQGTVLTNLVNAFRPATVEEGPGQTMKPGNSVGGYNPMPPMSYEASAVPLAKRVGDVLEEATKWAAVNAPQIQLFSDIAPGFSWLWGKVEDAATSAGVAAGAAASAVLDPMRAAADEAAKAASKLAKWVGVALVGGAALWLATKRGGGKAADPWG